MSRATKLRLRSLISISAALKIGSAARAPMMLAMSAVIHSLGIQGRAAFTCCVAGFAAMRRCVSCDVIGSLMSQFHHSFFRELCCVARRCAALARLLQGRLARESVAAQCDRFTYAAAVTLRAAGERFLTGICWAAARCRVPPPSVAATLPLLTGSLGCFTTARRWRAALTPNLCTPAAERRDSD